MSLDNIDIILVETSHPGNIGAAARAMKTMGLSQLVLVNPQEFPSVVATARASGADDLLANAKVYDNFVDSIRPYELVIATSARLRSITWPMLTPPECANKAVTQQGKVAIVFGREHSGLTNEELDHCHALVQISTEPNFSSLNIAAAVQVLSYELRCAAEQNEHNPLPTVGDAVTAEQMEYFYGHLEQALLDTGFLEADKPRLTMRKLRCLFNRAAPNQSEMNILRGILSSIEKAAKK
ncbi:MAG: RNA methyltransferase [Thiotrichaceae bacterium]|nr:RNA methyltransferase [Thiotrichaceae bacterium]